jgi:hypothetical protein
MTPEVTRAGDDVLLSDRGPRTSPWGTATHVQFTSESGRTLSWAEVYEAFAEAFPGCWAVEVYPPREFLVDEVNAYHLFVLPPGAELGDLRIDRGRP